MPRFHPCLILCYKLSIIRPIFSACGLWIGGILFELDASRFDMKMYNVFIWLISQSKLQVSTNGCEFTRTDTFTTKCWSHIWQNVREKSLNMKLLLNLEVSARFGRCHFVHVTLAGCGCPLPYRDPMGTSHISKSV